MDVSWFWGILYFRDDFLTLSCVNGSWKIALFRFFVIPQLLRWGCPPQNEIFDQTHFDIWIKIKFCGYFQNQTLRWTLLKAPNTQNHSNLHCLRVSNFWWLVCSYKSKQVSTFILYQPRTGLILAANMAFLFVQKQYSKVMWRVIWFPRIANVRVQRKN